MKRHGGWESSKVAESYIDDSIEEKIRTAQKILGTESTSTNENCVIPVSHVEDSNSDSCCSHSQKSGNWIFHNCTFNFDVKGKNE